jgi:hypothetical protein
VSTPRAALAEAAVSLATTLLLIAALRYGPGLAAAARQRLTRPAPAGEDELAAGEDELAVSDMRAELAGHMDPRQWEAENWGWE